MAEFFSFEPTGRARDHEQETLKKWLDSPAADFPQGASPQEIAATISSSSGPPISSISLSRWLSNQMKKTPERIMKIGISKKSPVFKIFPVGESFESPDKTHKRQKIGTRDLGPNNIIVDRRHFNRLKDTVCERDETIKEMNNALTAKDDTITAKDNTTAACVTETATSSDEKNSLLDFQEAQHRAAIAELAVMGNGVSHRTLAQLLPFGTYFTMKRMHALGT